MIKYSAIKKNKEKEKHQKKGVIHFERERQRKLSKHSS